MASLTNSENSTSLIDYPLPGQHALDAVTDDIVDMMRAYTQDTFISTICADQIEHFRQINNEPHKSHSRTRRHSTPAPTPMTMPISTSAQTGSRTNPESPVSPCSDGGSTQHTAKLNPQLNLLLYLHQKVQSLPDVLNMTRSCHGMDENALTHNEHTIRNLLARVKALGASMEDREFLDHLYSVKQVLWDKIVVWRLLEDKRYPFRSDLRHRDSPSVNDIRG